MTRFAAALTLLTTLTLSTSARADIKVDPPEVGVPLVMKTEKGAKTHRLILPKQFLKGVQVSQLESGEGNEAQVGVAGDHGRTILAGCALSMAVGSVVFLRRRQVAAAVVLVAGTLVLGYGSIGWADFAAEPPKQSVVIQFVEKGNEVIFVIPASK